MGKKIIFIFILFISSFFLFNLMEFELLNQSMNKYLQSLIFSIVLVVAVFGPKVRAKLPYAVFLLLLVSVLLYILNQLSLSNSFASIGIGMLLLIMLSYLPEIIKKGFVEKL